MFHQWHETFQIRSGFQAVTSVRCDISQTFTFQRWLPVSGEHRLNWVGHIHSRSSITSRVQLWLIAIIFSGLSISVYLHHSLILVSFISAGIPNLRAISITTCYRTLNGRTHIPTPHHQTSSDHSRCFNVVRNRSIIRIKAFANRLIHHFSSGRLCGSII